MPLKKSEYRQLKDQFQREFPQFEPEELICFCEFERGNFRRMRGVINFKDSAFNCMYKKFTYQHNNGHGYGWYPIAYNCDDFRDRFMRLMRRISNV